VRTIVTLAALAALMGSPCMAQSEGSIESRNKALVKAGFEAWASGSPYDLLADDASWSIIGHSVASKTYPSKEAFLREVIRPFNARMSGGLKPTIRDIYAEGDTGIVFFGASGTARDGRPYANTYAWFLGLENGKVVKTSAFFDSIVFDDFWQRVQPDSSKSRKE
jgi:ketosteroid isomerase-like protein